MQIEPYIFFDGRCEEALEFYRHVLGASIENLVRFKDCPEPGMTPPGSENKVMHARLRVGDAIMLASDGRCLGQPEFKGFSLAVTLPTAAEADRVFTALADGGEVRMPMSQTFFSPRFGMAADRFGVGWMVLVART